MHNNYYFLRQLSSQLKQEIKGFTIGPIFSQAKDELIISLYNQNDERFIKANLSPSFSCLSFPPLLNRARKNSVDLFSQVLGMHIQDIVQIDQDRSFYFQLENGYKLLFKMHGNRANLILILDQKIIEVFKNSLKHDFSIHIDELPREVFTDRSSFDKNSGNYKKLIPTFGKSFDSYFDLKNYDEISPDKQFDLFITLLEYLKNPAFYVHKAPEDIPKLSLYRLHEEDEKYNSPIEALNAFYRTYISIYALEKGKISRRNSLNAQIKKCESYVDKTSGKLETLKSALNYRHIADLIMANLHQIKQHTNEVSLIDFYTNKEVKIQLKPTLTPQLNAEKYYKKAKNQQIEIDSLNSNLESRRAQIVELKKQIEELENITKVKQLNKKVTVKPKEADLPYHAVTFLNYEILIGKNAIKNEKLSFQVAKKDDLFLHAKDTPGSHVIIKKKSNQNFPQRVIEKAASYAAHYSKNKSESLCRVLYTPKKFVRKAKGAPAGAVIVEREKVILVKPEKL